MKPIGRHVSLSIAAAALAGFLCGCQGSSNSLHFEPAPRCPAGPLSTGPWRHPKLWRKPSGTVYILAVEASGPHTRLGLLGSENGGDTFSTRVPVGEDGMEVSSHGENSPNLVLGPTQIYVSWERMNAGGESELVLSRSRDFGRSFLDPVRVSDGPARAFAAFSALGITADGESCLAWLDGRDQASDPIGTFSVRFARSSDQGARFGSSVSVAKGACPCCRPAMLVASNEVYVSWRGVFDDNIRDLRLATSHDGGKSFDPPVRVATDAWKISGCPHSGPTLAVSNGRLYVAWYTEGSDRRPRINLSWSEDRGRTFSRPVDVSGNVLDPNHPVLAVSEDGAVILAFQGRTPRKGDWASQSIYLVRFDPDGVPGRPVSVPSGTGSASYPSVVAGSSGRLLLAWTEEADGDRVVLIRGRTVAPPS